MAHSTGGSEGNRNYAFPQYSQGSYKQPQGSQYGQPQNYYQQGGYSQEAPGTSYQQGFGQQQGYNPNNFAAPNAQASYPQAQAYNGAAGGMLPDSLVSDLAAGVLQQQGENYFQRGQAFVQSKMGFLSSNNLQYHFSIDKTYVRDKILLLLLPFLRRWTFSRKPEQISGGHRYQPPRQDVYAPDLYIPFMAICTYIVLFGILQTAEGKFSHDSMYITVSGAFSGWLVHWVVIKATLYLLGIPSSVPFLEVLAYAGYPFLYASLGLLTSFLGLWPHRAFWLYGGLAMGTFMVRSITHVIFRDAAHSRRGSMHTYILLGLAIFQFPFLAYFYSKP